MNRTMREYAACKKGMAICFWCLVIVGVFALIALSGCANKDLTSQEQHRVAAKQLVQEYEWLHQEVQRLDQVLPSQAREDLQELKGPLNDLKQVLDSYLGFVIAGAIEDAEKHGARLQQETNRLITRVVALGLKYGVEVTEDE